MTQRLFEEMSKRFEDSSAQIMADSRDDIYDLEDECVPACDVYCAGVLVRMCGFECVSRSMPCVYACVRVCTLECVRTRANVCLLAAH